MGLKPSQLAALHAKDHAQGHGPLPGHELLTMHDQMSAMHLPHAPRVSPSTGAVESPRRAFLKARIQQRASQTFGGSAVPGPTQMPD